MGRYGLLSKTKQLSSVVTITAKTNLIRLGVKPQYTNITHRHRQTDRHIHTYTGTQPV